LLGAIAAFAPAVPGVRREFLKRLGLRRQDVDAAGREAVDLYSGARAKLTAIDRHRGDHPG